MSSDEQNLPAIRHLPAAQNLPAYIPILTLKGGSGKTGIYAMFSGNAGGGKSHSTRIHAHAEEFTRRGRMSHDVIDGEVVEPLRALPAGPDTDPATSSSQNSEAPQDRPEYRSAAAGVPASIRMTTYVVMEHLLESNLVAFVELVYLARDPERQLFAGTHEVIESLGLFDAFGKLHTAVRDVVLAAAAGDGLGIELLPIGAF
ncbi:Uncharacterised protein (plasmid) [Tsukamurella tyrosinosolvens]|uniref:Uncharacterized protein n=1 Tax=Tsukamurella tyrosinosolvens TaxID=57704 RepID=A0A1H4UKF5_TSUTY|nr:hypothetical protein [Tsukamurella tyrosinosolvens]KXO92904.1 hypothetical protein AXK58_13600 [Tsukamurella tyrosinosolvens]SEC68614.1 hypothetical protein SAMN04489793_2918 [Tsukamurella tyrosinosolvens]VEH94259.1 Uncharacterised protein [Tsukamurella tyrosinosolvens]